MEAVIFIGIQASGKSSFYKESFFRTHIRINLDMLKKRSKEDIIIDACIRAGQSFVIDNTNPSVSDRKKYINLAKTARFKVIGYYFETTLDDAIDRNQSRIGKECIPVAGIRCTNSKLERPSFDEGFNKLYSVWIKENSFLVEEWNKNI